MGEFYIEITPRQIRIVLLADQTVMSNGGLTEQPFIFANGRLRLLTTDIGDVVVDYIHSSGGGFLIALNNQRITMGD